MERLTCWNSASQLLEQMYQWDDNRILKIKGGALEANTSYEIHMNNKRMAKSFVLVPEIDDYFFIVEVPAALLETPDTIAVYLYAENDLTHEMRVVGTAHIKVIPRGKPADYVSEPTSGLRMVADGLAVQDGKVYLTNGGVPFGDGADIGGGGGGTVHGAASALINGVVSASVHGTAETLEV